MKTKFLFSMACATALLAACQSDELMEQSGIVNNANRPTIDLRLSAEDQNLGNGDAATRMGAEVVGESMKYSWVSTDRLGAAVMDGTTYGTYETDNKVLFNYPFDFTAGAEEGASSFTAKSPVMVGTYFFYHQYKQNTARDVLKLELEDQQAYVSGEGAETAENQMAKYIIGISPAIKLSEGIEMDDNGASSLALPIQFKKINAAIQFNITPKDLPEGTEITKIVVEKSGMVLGGTVDFGGGNNPLGAATVAVDVKSYDESAKGGNDNGVLDTEELEKLSGAIATATEAINLDQLFTSSETTDAITLSMYANSTAQSNGERGIALTNGTALTAYVVVPAAGTAAADDYIVKIYTTEGYVEKEVKDLKIESGKVYASKFKFDLNKSELQDIEEFEIASSVDWSEAVQFVKDHVDNYVGADKIKFNITSTAKDPIYVSELPAYGINLKGNAAYYICLGNEDGSAASFDMSKTSLKLEDTHLNLMVGKGAIVKLNALPAGGQAFNVINNGTLDVAVAAPTASVANFTNNADMTVSVAQSSNDMTIENKGNLSFAGSTTATATEYKVALTNRKNVTIPAKASVIAAATFVNDDNNAATSNATITINGSLSGDAVTDLTEKFVIGSTGILEPKASGAINEGAVISNSGTLKGSSLTNNGTINVKADSKSNNDVITNKGTIVIEDIDNYIANQEDLNKGAVKYNINNGTSGTTSAIVSKKSQLTNLSANYVNNITISGAWTVGSGNGDTTVDATTFQAIGVTLENATLTVGEATVAATNLPMIVKGNSSIVAASGVTPTLDYKTLTVNNNATMSIGKGVTFEVQETANAGVTVLGSLTNNGTLTSTGAWKMTVGANMPNVSKHPAKLTNAKDAVIGTDGTAKVAITNYGTVDFKLGTAYGTITNNKSAVFEGNIQQ